MNKPIPQPVHGPSLGRLRFGFLLAAVLLFPLATPANETFTYDAAGRLKLASYGPSHFIQYEYDLLGHLTQLTVSATSTDTDSDEDQLPDAWEWVHFGGLHEMTESDSNGNGRTNLDDFLAGSDPATLDNDRDGVLNADELLGGTDPFAADSYPHLRLLPGSLDTLSWDGQPDRRYRILRAADPLGNFEPVTDYLPAVPTGNLWTDSALHTTARFYRLEITLGSD